MKTVEKSADHGNLSIECHWDSERNSCATPKKPIKKAVTPVKTTESGHDSTPVSNMRTRKSSNGVLLFSPVQPEEKARNLASGGEKSCSQSQFQPSESDEF